MSEVEISAPEPAPEVVAEAAAAEPEIAAADVPVTLDTLFLEARTHYAWRPEPVSEAEIHRLYALLRMGPTSANASPGRFLFLRKAEAKERLRPALSAGNLEKTLAAPLVVIVAHDPRFFEKLPQLYPQVDARSWFANNEALAATTAFRNGTLQGAYLLMAARAVGLDCGPMSGFDNAKLDTEFFPDGRWRSNFLLNIGYGEPAGLRPRLPRLDFAEVARRA